MIESSELAEPATSNFLSKFEHMVSNFRKSLTPGEQ